LFKKKRHKKGKRTRHRKQRHLVYATSSDKKKKTGRERTFYTLQRRGEPKPSEKRASPKKSPSKGRDKNLKGGLGWGEGKGKKLQGKEKVGGDLGGSEVNGL